ncbi:Mu transposase C-terminal domain-containing protein [Streptomyces sp. 796.1]|uniref:Mu transposase C-terminal domain-containing protein n=1 Tax=Streptomyces sp. 796.1 TaxID=3163029 RepID=UPI0039C97727
MTTQGVWWRNRHYITPWMVGQAGFHVAVRHLPHHDMTIEVFDLRVRTWAAPFWPRQPTRSRSTRSAQPAPPRRGGFART